MTTRYVVWISIEKCEVEDGDYDAIESVGEPRQAGCFRSEEAAYKHVERLLKRPRASREAQKISRRSE